MYDVKFVEGAKQVVDIQIHCCPCFSKGANTPHPLNEPVVKKGQG